MRLIVLMIVLLSSTVAAQDSVYKNTLPADPPYYRVRYEASTVEGELIYPASYTVWIPPATKILRGVIVHQHGCGEGSCKSGLTGAYDLHWQALARKHDCALLAPVIEQPEKADCQKWCDPRNGSDAVFQRSLMDLGNLSGHPEMATVPWAIWGHSGGGHWAGGMVLLHPERVAAAWLRSGVPPLTAAEGKPKPYEIPEAACKVPMMCNLGTLEGVTDKEGRFSGVWPGVEAFSKKLRSRNALLGVSIDPISSHDCGNQRYLAMPWFDACLSARLSKTNSSELNPLSPAEGWIGQLSPGAKEIEKPVPAAEFKGELETSVWLPNDAVAIAWTQYSRDTAVQDPTPPPAPEALVVSGGELKWTATADLESGLAGFVIERDGELLKSLPETPRNPFGRPVFQNLSYSDTPAQPLVEMRYTDASQVAGKNHRYRIFSVNTVGARSEKAAE